MKLVMAFFFILITACENQVVKEELPVYRAGFFSHCETNGEESTETWYVFSEDQTGSWFTKSIFHFDYSLCTGDHKRFVESYQYSVKVRSNSLVLTKRSSNQKVFTVAEVLERNANLYCEKNDWNNVSQVNTTGLDCDGNIFEENDVEEIEAILTDDSLTIDGLILENQY